MEFLLILAQALFILFIFAIALLYLFCLLLAWAWGQSTSEIEEDQMSFGFLLSTAAIEWGAILTLIPGQILGSKIFHEAPKITSGRESPKQIPVIFVPSLQTGAGIFRILLWRLKEHYFTSLWPFSWKPFLIANDLLEDQLLDFLQNILKKTESPAIRMISFGSSRPVIGRVLKHPSLSEIQVKWIAISAPKSLSQTLRFLSSPKSKSVYSETRMGLEPDLLIRGQTDLFCYPDSVWGEGRQLKLPTVGHFAAVLYPTTVQRILDEIS